MVNRGVVLARNKLKLQTTIHWIVSISPLWLIEKKNLVEASNGWSIFDSLIHNSKYMAKIIIHHSLSK